ncbi:uncharacterized protein B0H64DRAFT_463409 [Chaetomium fimeti]|uniref:RRM domain-containing protein n=1 Tax=Chaetomium fimeti TaxID=1854472 RepID=A0AAE0HDF8_9PEZI|nr:hypothetical protein B0H64DRAFT_463409 [Chaetomium fimeti]
MSSNDHIPIFSDQGVISSEYHNLPRGDVLGDRASVHAGLSAYAEDQQARGSRWFGPNGVFGPSRASSPVAQEEEGNVAGGYLSYVNNLNVIKESNIDRFYNADNGVNNIITHNNIHQGFEPARAPTPAWQANPGYPAITPRVNGVNATPPPTANGDFGPSTLVPSRMQQVAEVELLNAPRAPRRDLREAGVSGNYRGDINNPRNLSANIAEEQNCSFWLRRLPADTTVTTLLAAVRGIGRVYCTVIAPASRAHGWHTAAAKLVFFDQAAARRFWALYGRRAVGPQAVPLVVGGQHVLVERNRTRVAETTLPRDTSRVVRVTGPAAVVNVGALLAEFQANFVFEMDEVAIGTEDRVTAVGLQTFVVVEFRFGSFRCQAQIAYRLLQGRRGLEVRYGRDPCDL